MTDEDSVDFPHAVGGFWPKLTCVFDDLDVPADPGAPLSRYVVLAYDDVFSLEYHRRKLRPYWRRAGMDIGGLLKAAVADHDALRQRCVDFDAELSADLVQAGGQPYAELCALAYRQCCAAHKLAVDFDGSPVYFSKENFSNGCINTVDVTYPSAPFFLLLNPVLLRAQIEPICTYARSPRWQFPFAPHDLGRLAFNRPDTWSLKYNLVWDRLLELNLFPVGVVRKELAFYRGKMQRYGLPLDNRKNYGKLDWSVWIAALAEGREEFDFFVAPLHRWAHESRSRVPLTDWYWTTMGQQTCWGRGLRGPAGFQARSVVGGVFIKLLFDAGISAKWREQARAAGSPSPGAGLVREEGRTDPVTEDTTKPPRERSRASP